MAPLQVLWRISRPGRLDVRFIGTGWVTSALNQACSLAEPLRPTMLLKRSRYKYTTGVV